MKILTLLALVCIMASCRGIPKEKLDELAIREILDALEEEVTEKEEHKLQPVEEEAARRRVALLSEAPVLPVRPPDLINTCVNHECCDNRVAAIDLNTGSVVSSFPNGITIHRPITAGKGKCSATGVLKVNFEPIQASCPCVSVPFFGRRMLKLDLFLAPGSGSRSGFMFAVGDSITNDGYGGDGNTQLYDAEVNGIFPNILAYTNDICKKEGIANEYAKIDNALATGIDKVTLYIANGYTRVVYGDSEKKLCSKCLFGLSNQDNNSDLYISLNTVVTMRADRTGFGVCRAEASWVCPEH